MKGQLSAEMLILIVVVLAIVALVANQMLSTAEKGADKIDEQSDDLFSKTDEFTKADEGEFCVENDDCLSDSCIDSHCN